MEKNIREEMDEADVHEDGGEEAPPLVGTLMKPAHLTQLLHTVYLATQQLVVMERSGKSPRRNEIRLKSKIEVEDN